MAIGNYEEELMRKFKAGDAEAINEVMELFEAPANITCTLILSLTKNEKEVLRIKKRFQRVLKEVFDDHHNRYQNLRNVRIKYGQALNALMPAYLEIEKIDEGELFKAYFDKLFILIEQMPSTQSLVMRYLLTHKVHYESVSEKLGIDILEIIKFTLSGLEELDARFAGKYEREYFLLMRNIRGF